MKKSNTKIGIFGLGIVGSALHKYLTKDSFNKFALYDPAKELKDSMENCDCFFICVSVPVTSSYQCEVGEIVKCLKIIGKTSSPVFIRSTISMRSMQTLKDLTGNNNLYYMPEFLTERIADKEMERLGIICGSDDNLQKVLVRCLFPDKKVTFVKNEEAEIIKLFHNCFGAMKVIFFNIIKLLAEQSQCDYEQIVNAMLMTGFISPEHTKVPGHDEKQGFGGKCFPKDLGLLIGSFLLMKPSNPFCAKVRDLFMGIEDINNMLRPVDMPSVSNKTID